MGLVVATGASTNVKHGEAVGLKPTTAKGYVERGAAHVHSQAWENAIGDFGEAIRINPKDPVAYEWRGTAFLLKGDLTRAISDFNQALQFNPTNARVYLNRANAFVVKRELDKAIADLNECLRLSPQDADARATRADCLADKGRFDKAVIDYVECIRVDPKNPHAYNGLGLLRASCPVAAMRDSKQAVELATKACQLTEWAEPTCIDTLAAAFAEAGEFDKAIKYQRQAMNMNRVGDKRRKDMQRRLTLYEQRKPYHEKPGPSQEERTVK